MRARGFAIRDSGVQPGWPRDARRPRRLQHPRVLLEWLLGGLLLVAALGCSTPAAAPAETPRGPVAVLITVSSLRADSVEGIGGPPGLTPSLAALAQQSQLATAAVATSSSELAALASVFSGLLPSDHGVWSWELDQISPQLPWLPDRLLSAGIPTRAFLARNSLSRESGWSRGFDQWHPIGRLRSARAALLEPPPGPSFTWVDLRGPRPPWSWTSVAAAAAAGPLAGPPRLGIDDLAALASGQGRHGGREPDDLIALYRHDVAASDSELGQLLDAIEESGRAPETLLIVCADTGYALGEDGSFGTAQGLSPGEIEVPLLIRVPIGTLELATELRWPSSARIAATVLEAFGLAAPPAMAPSLTRRLGEPAASELPVSGGRRLASVVAHGLQLVAEERWGPVEPSALHPDTLDPTTRAALLASRPWREPLSSRSRQWSGAMPGKTTQALLQQSLERLVAAPPGRVGDHRRLAAAPELGAILQPAPRRGASGP